VAVLRSRRIETLLGTSLDAIRHSHLASLVTGKVSETFDVDFKGTLYGKLDDDKRNLAGDVAALANTAGGILVLGIEEDKQARAAAAPGVPISDAEIRRMHQIVASLVAPLPAFDILAVPEPGKTDHGFLVVAVPPSPFAPHAVLAGVGLRFPRRNGTTTRYLSEPEVATAYRERFARAEGQAVRAGKIEEAAMGRLKRADDHIWILVSLVPGVPGEMLIDQASLTAIQAEVGRSPFPTVMPTSFSWYRVEVAPRRILLSGSPDSTWLTGWLAADLHSDGAGAFAMNSIGIGGRGPATDGAEDVATLHDEQAVNAIVSGLRFLGRHARDRAGASGDALIHVKIQADPGRAVRLGAGTRGFGDHMGRPLRVPARTAEAAAQLDALADEGPDLLAASYLLASELFQDFGLPEAMQLTRDGEIRRRYWTKAWLPQIEAWAAAAGVTVTDAEPATTGTAS
jgi:Schlafen, AlbA_2